MRSTRSLVALPTVWAALAACAASGGGAQTAPVPQPFPFHADADLVHGRGADVGLGVPFDPATEPVVRYVVDLDAPTTQTVHVTVTLPCAGRDEVELFLPVWRPGRYEILDPAGSLREVQARADGEPRAVRKTSKSSWAVPTGGAAELTVSYRVYANSLGDRTRHVDDTHAFLSGSTVFLYAPSLRAAPLTVAVRAPEDWKVATGLESVPGEARVLFAPSYDVLVDSPLEIGRHDRHVFEVDGRPHEIVVWPAGIELDFERIAEDLAKIVRAQEAVFGSLPYERYVFLIHAAGGGGTEHLNSTIMQTSRAVLEASVDGGPAHERLLGLASHEFFHTWNVKQLRPAGIHPYDYQRENYTDLLWVAEGTTSYYSALTLARADLRKPARYLEQLARSIGSLRELPGARVQSVAASSFDQWISDFGPDAMNSQVSIYGEGALVSFWLDLEVRRRSGGKASLDDVLRDLYERFPLSGTGYTSADLIAALDAAVGAGPDGPFEELFARHVDGTEPLPFEESVGAVGLRLWFEPATREKDEAQADEDAETTEAPGPLPMKPTLGLRLADSGSGSRITGILADGPAYGADLLVGDELLTLNEKRLRAGDLDERLEDLAPGDTVRLHLLRRDELRVVELTVAGVPDGTWKLERVEDPTDAQRAAYASWLGSEWPGKKPGADETERAGELSGKEWGVQTPFWASDTMKNETLFFVSDGEDAASAPLLFQAEKVLRVQSADLETTYVEGKDYALGPDSRSLVRLPGSRMPVTTRAELYPPASAEHAIAQRADGETWLLFSEGHFFHDLQVNVTYTHADRWTGVAPRFEAETLPRTIARLKARERLTVSVSGDSISAGGNASLFTGAAPGQPAYPQLVVEGLEEAYGTPVVLKNRAVSGWRADEGVADAENVARDEPDLVVIAYGMNDNDPASYSANVRKIMETIRARCPDVEFLLVASMTGNPEWSRMDLGKFARFRGALLACAGPGVAVADVTTLWKDVLASKRFHDLTGNGVNHPNDFGHRLYAQAILGLLIDDRGGR